MKFKSALVTQVSGSIGGMTGSRNRSGMYFRARSMPVNPQTSLQTVTRDALNQTVTRWGDLTDIQRENWANYANNVPWQNVLGDTIKLTGNTMYSSCNCPRIQAGLTIIDDAPTLFNTPAIVSPAVVQDGTTPFGIEFQFDSADVEATDVILVYVSIPKSPSINFFKGPYRFNAQGTGTGPGIVALVPNPTWVIGQKLFVRARISYTDGRLSPNWRGDIILDHTPV